MALYMLSAPDSARAVADFEEVISRNDQSTAHHEEAYHLQVKFLQHVKSLTAVLRERGNPFLDTSSELGTLGTRDVMECHARADQHSSLLNL